MTTTARSVNQILFMTLGRAPTRKPWYRTGRKTQLSGTRRIGGGKKPCREGFLRSASKHEGDHDRGQASLPQHAAVVRFRRRRRGSGNGPRDLVREPLAAPGFRRDHPG